MIQESKLLIAKSLINYTKLDFKKYSIFDNKKQYVGKRVVRPGCPLSEKDLKRQLIDCTSVIMKDIGLEKESRLSLLASLEHCNPEGIAANLQSIIQRFNLAK